MVVVAVMLDPSDLFGRQVDLDHRCSVGAVIVEPKG
jgi:hypothetical protein